jgi:hypothetical protein
MTHHGCMTWISFNKWANRCLHTKYKRSRWKSDETCHPRKNLCILTSVTLKSRSNQKPGFYVIVLWDKPTIKIWSSYLWPLTLKWQVWFSRWPPRGEKSRKWKKRLGVHVLPKGIITSSHIVPPVTKCAPLMDDGHRAMVIAHLTQAGELKKYNWER